MRYRGAMRILYIASQSDRPEAHIIAGLAARGHAIRVIAEPAGPWIDLWRAAGATVQPLVIRSRFDRDARAMLRRVVHDFGPDVVHAFTNRGLAAAVPVLRGLPARLVAYRGTTGHLSRWDPAARLSYLHPRVDAIVCVADAVRAYLASKGVPPQKLATIRKGHDPAWYAELAPPARGELGIRADAVLVGYVANMRKVKGATVLLRAVASLPAESRIQLLLVGEVRDRAVRTWLRRPALAGRVVTTGFRADAARLARAFDIFAMPSLDREGLPKAVVEAMAQGVAPVVSDAGGLPELVEHGVSGLVVPAGDADALAAALSALASDAALRARLAAGARARIEGAFSLGATLDAVESLYRRLCGARSGSARSRDAVA